MSKSQFETIIDQLPKGNLLEHLPQLHSKLKKCEITKKDKKLIIKNLEEVINKKQVRHMVNWLLLGLIVAQDGTIVDIRKKGLFRPSKYDFQTKHIQQTIRKILGSKARLTDEAKTYLNSILFLSNIGVEVLKKYTFLLKELRKGGDLLFRHLLAMVDYIFMLQVTKGVICDETAPSNTLQYYQPEDLAEAVSFIYYQYFSKITNGEPRLKFPLNTSTEEAEKLLIIAAEIKTFQEYEALVDGLGYIIEQGKDQEHLIISSLDQDLEIATRLGYILNSQQFVAFNILQDMGQAVSIKTLAEESYKIIGNKLSQFKREPIPRYVFSIPMVDKVIEALSSESLYEEEVRAFMFAQREWLVHHEQIRNFLVSTDITLWDITLAQRYMNFIRWLAVSDMLPKIDTEEEIVLNSLVSSFKTDDLIEMLKPILGEKAEEVINFLTWNPDQKGVFDIQYQPLLKTGDHTMIPTNIMCNSNLLRNSLQLSKRRFYEDGQVDPTEDVLEAALKDKTGFVAKNISYKYNGQSGEVDVVAIIDDTLFVFECKNSLLPCNVFEARTSLDYIIKGADQLGKFAGFSNDQLFLQYFLKKLKWPTSVKLKVVTCIVMTNRMFAGYRYNNQPVRGSKEIIAQLTNGQIQIGDKKYCTWKKETFSDEDLRSYIEDDITYQPMWDALQDFNRINVFGKLTIEFRSVAIDASYFMKNVGFREIVEK